VLEEDGLLKDVARSGDLLIAHSKPSFSESRPYNGGGKGLAAGAARAFRRANYAEAYGETCLHVLGVWAPRGGGDLRFEFKGMCWRW